MYSIIWVSFDQCPPGCWSAHDDTSVEGKRRSRWVDCGHWGRLWLVVGIGDFTTTKSLVFHGAQKTISELHIDHKGLDLKKNTREPIKDLIYGDLKMGPKKGFGVNNVKPLNLNALSKGRAVSVFISTRCQLSLSDSFYITFLFILAVW